MVAFYLDGVAYPAGIYTLTNGLPPGYPNSGFWFYSPAAIGGRADKVYTTNNASFLGNIDEVSVYNRPLAIYAAGASGKCDPGILNVSGRGAVERGTPVWHL